MSVELISSEQESNIEVKGAVVPLLVLILLNLGLATSGAGDLGRHDKPRPAVLAQVAVEVADPDVVVAVTDFALLGYYIGHLRRTVTVLSPKTCCQQ